MPMRYGLPLLMVPLVPWVATTSKQAPSILLAVLATTTLLNNLDFGIPAFGAVVVSLWCGARMRGSFPWKELRHLAIALAAGVALVALIARTREGAWPAFTDMLYFPRQFALAGLGMIPLPGVFGLHLLIFLTFAGGFALAIVAASQLGQRGVAQVSNRRAVCLLAYSSTFGLGTGTYYVGRSDYHVLVALFCAWGLCLVSIFFVVSLYARTFSALRPEHRLLVAPGVAVLGASLVLCLGTLPLQAPALKFFSRYTQQASPIFDHSVMRKLVRDCTNADDDVMMIYPNGYRIASLARVRNHFPYGSPTDLITFEQVDQIGTVLRRHPTSLVFTSREYLVEAMQHKLEQNGWRRLASRHDNRDELLVWTRESDSDISQRHAECRT